MHVIPFIIGNEEEEEEHENDNPNNNSAHNIKNMSSSKTKSVQEMEALAVQQAKRSADAAFSPPASVWKSSDPQLLLKTVDGTDSLKHYQAKESTYVGRSVPIAAGGNLTIPIQVATPGSVVEYAVEIEKYDISFGITAEREEGVTIVKPVSRIGNADSPVTQKFLVGTVPCLLTFALDNAHSWMREKIASYKITVAPPSPESLAEGRLRRAQACLQAVQADIATAQERLAEAQGQRHKLDAQVQALETELEETRKAAAAAAKEEEWLATRTSVRAEQQKLLEQRLKQGWPDGK